MFKRILRKNTDSYYKINKKQKVWLSSRGGRNVNDLRVAPNGELYVNMGNGDYGYVRVYLPKI